jgi:ferredoxin-NADP reductase
MPETEASTSTHERLIWRVAEVAKIVDETPRVKSLVLDVPGWPGHRPGQHVDVRLTAEDGYQAQRSYSVASEPESTRLMLTVELIEEGEVSPYLTSDVRPGDKFELTRPHRRLFRLDRRDRRPALPCRRRFGYRATHVHAAV